MPTTSATTTTTSSMQNNNTNEMYSINANNCGQRPLVSNQTVLKIVGGVQALNGDWPWQIIMFYDGGFTCGGSLINSLWVVTAAHCVYGRSSDPSRFTIGLGYFDRNQLNSWSVIKTVTRIIIHASYNSNTFADDIALMKLDSQVTFSNYVLPVCIPDSSNYAGMMSTATGWGTTSSGGSTSRYLMQVTMPWLTDAACIQKYGINSAIIICAGDTGGNKDTCQGDSGGPLVVQVGNKWMLGGITSFGIGCNDGGAYARASFYNNWILQNLQQDQTLTTTPPPISVYGTLFTRGDDNTGIVSINFNFKYFNNLYSQLTISTNGFVYFSLGSTSGSASGNSISALNYDLDTRYSGGIYYQNLNSQSNDFNSIRADINRLNSSFVPTNLFRITYENVPGWQASSLIASFQIILASDSSKSYVVLKYTSCLSPLVTPGLYYLNSNGQQMSNQFTNPCSSSNVNLIGTWVFNA